MQHVECIGYLLRQGADPFAETDKGETCLHLAAKNAYTECLSEILSARVSVGGGPPTRLADAKLPYTPPVKFVDMRNGENSSPKPTSPHSLTQPGRATLRNRRNTTQQPAESRLCKSLDASGCAHYQVHVLLCSCWIHASASGDAQEQPSSDASPAWGRGVNGSWHL